MHSFAGTLERSSFPPMAFLYGMHERSLPPMAFLYDTRERLNAFPCTYGISLMVRLNARPSNFGIPLRHA
jgi:hypothetical protein